MKSMRQQFADTMLAVGQKDEKLVVLVGDISHFILQPFAKACPGRYYNVGICEPTIITMGAGLAKVGFYPVMHTIAPFLLERPFEHVKLDFCYQKLGGSLITVGSAFDYANLGCTHHCYDDFALLKSLPGTQITYPATPVEFDTLFRQTYNNSSLTLFRLPGAMNRQEFSPEKIVFGKGMRLTEGKDLTIIATGPQLQSALDARDTLAGLGWDIEILYIHTIRPLDTALVRESVSKTKRVLVIEEHMRTGGLGDDVMRATLDIAGIKYAFIAIPDAFVTGYGSYENHCAQLGLDRDGVINKVKQEFGKKRGK
jgi:transketolase